MVNGLLNTDQLRRLWMRGTVLMSWSTRRLFSFSSSRESHYSTLSISSCHACFSPLLDCWSISCLLKVRQHQLLGYMTTGKQLKKQVVWTWIVSIERLNICPNLSSFFLLSTFCISRMLFCNVPTKAKEYNIYILNLYNFKCKWFWNSLLYVYSLSS